MTVHSSPPSAKNEQQIHITYVDIDELRPADYNPREHDSIEKDQLKESLQTFGTVDPLIVNVAPNRRRPATPGEYSVTLYVGDVEYTTSITVEDLSRSNDPNVMVPRE